MGDMITFSFQHNAFDIPKWLECESGDQEKDLSRHFESLIVVNELAQEEYI